MLSEESECFLRSAQPTGPVPTYVFAHSADRSGRESLYANEHVTQTVTGKPSDLRLPGQNLINRELRTKTDAERPALEKTRKPVHQLWAAAEHDRILDERACAACRMVL